MALAPFAEIEARIAVATSSRLANAYVVPVQGEPFGAEFNRADEMAFDAVTAGADVLVYVGQHDLRDGDDISINGDTYRVAGVPRKKDGHFSVCDVVAV